MIGGSPKSLVPFPSAITGSHQRSEGSDEFAKQMATERFPELVDELKRRGAFTEVTAHAKAVEARIDFSGREVEACVDPDGFVYSAKIAPYVFVYIGAGSSWNRPYVVRAEMNTEARYNSVGVRLMSERELSFEGVLMFVDDFLAGFKDGQASMQGSKSREDRLVIEDT